MNIHGKDIKIFTANSNPKVAREIAQALAATTPPVSLTAGEGEGGGQLDLPVDSPEELLSDILALKQAMERMEDRDRRLIILRCYQIQTQTHWGSGP